MKLRFLLLCFLFFSCKTFSQHKAIHFYSSIATFTNAPSIVMKGPTLVGGGIDPVGNGSYCFGINYTAQIKKALEFETGIQMTFNKIKVSYQNDMPYYPNILMPSPTYGNIDLISIPVKARLSFLKYFFVTGGVLFDFETKNSVRDSSNNQLINSQSGIGIVVSAGAKYDFKEHITVFTNLTIEDHGIYLYQKLKYPFQINNLFLNMGIGYRF